MILSAQQISLVFQADHLFVQKQRGDSLKIMKVLIFVEKLIVILVIVAMAAGLYFFVNSVKKTTAEKVFVSQLRQMGQILVTYSLDSDVSTFVNGGCAPGANSCTLLSDKSPLFSGAPDWGNQMGVAARQIVDQAKNTKDTLYMQSAEAGWTISAQAPLVADQKTPVTYCVNSSGAVRACTGYPDTEKNSMCPDSGDANGKSFTCTDVNY